MTGPASAKPEPTYPCPECQVGALRPAHVSYFSTVAGRPVAEFVRQLEYYRLWHRLAPMVWVRYLRKAWQLPGGQLRITFDSGIQAVKARRKVELMPEWRKNLLSGWVVMELKYSGMLPKWIYRVISEYSLTRQPIGKYRLALEGLGMVLSV